MAGYKRVNFYELCRLCASNQQKEKTHIFQEEGRKIQLQSKIQSCLSLKVCENDFLPKVVCSQCLQSLEDCFTFRNGCVTSEAMLSSYFTNFRHTEDFKKSGKVYIKDTTAIKSEISAPLILNVSHNNLSTSSSKSHESQYYAVHVSTSDKNQKVEQVAPKVLNATQSFTYNVNAVNLAGTKSHHKADSLNELIKIESDTLNSIICNGTVRKSRPKQTNCNAKSDKSDNIIVDNLIQIGLTQQENNNAAYEVPSSTSKIEKPNSNNHEPKYMYTLKIEEDKNAAFVLNHLGQIQNFDSINNASSILNLQPTSVPQNNINNTGNSNNSKAEHELKSGSTVNTNVFNNINLVPSGVHLNGTNLNLMSVSNANGTNQLQAIDPSDGTTSNANAPTTAANNEQAICSNGAQQFAATATFNGTNKNVLSNLAVISRISNLSRTKTKDPSAMAVNESNTLTDSTAYNTVIFNNNMQSSSTDSKTTTATNNNTANSSTKQYVCEECKKVFKRREHLYQHVKLHTGFRPYVCENCNKSFMRKEHLLRHMISHSGQKNYTCNICEKSFSRNDNLLKHKKTHERQQSYTCEVCQKQFVMKHYYLAHKMAHEDDKVNFDVAKWNNLSV